MMEYFGASPELQAVPFYLHYQVFVLEQNILAKLEFDQLDTPDRQYLVFLKEKIDELTLNPDRLCLHLDHRQQGLGKKHF